MKQTIFLALFSLVYSKCVEYEASNPPYYCEDIVTWDVSEAIYEDRWNLNKQAYQLYYTLKTKYEDLDSADPTLNCLAVARKFYCSYNFPYCTDDEDERGVCDFLCDIWETRCPKEEYKKYCKNSESSRCSWSKELSMIGILIIMIVV